MKKKCMWTQQTLIEIWFEREKKHAAGMFKELASRFVMKFVHIRMKTKRWWIERKEKIHLK